MSHNIIMTLIEQGREHFYKLGKKKSEAVRIRNVADILLDNVLGSLDGAVLINLDSSKRQITGKYNVDNETALSYIDSLFGSVGLIYSPYSASLVAVRNDPFIKYFK